VRGFRGQDARGAFWAGIVSHAMRFPGAVGGAKNLHYRTRELTYEKGHTLFVLGPSRKVVEVPGFFSEILKKKSSGLFFSYLFSL
tara:strand:- start:383 stop:637 length:255 start_codon:yes stop_codon:yes gene_type:complete